MRNPDSSRKTRWAPNLAAFFLPAASASFSSARSPFHYAPRLGAPVSANSSRGNTEVLLDDLSDAARGPDLGRVTMSHRTPQQKPNQTPTLYDGQLGWPARRGADLQCLDASAAPSIAPAHDRTRRASEEPSDFIQRTPFVQQRQCTTSPELEHVSRTLGSRHGSLLRRHLLLHSLRRSQ